MEQSSDDSTIQQDHRVQKNNGYKKNQFFVHVEKK